ncbi:hypothetical protein G9A89_009280 [Geosiphon pyriformis]|nr:hypothetical protein G9A89_009280 [Geosiphon pyriformis]
MDMVISNQLGKITNAQFEELQTQITQIILENEIQEILQEGELTDIAVIKKTTKGSGSNDGFRPVLLRKKKKGGILEDGFCGENIGLISSETGDTTESESINMEEECLVEETSFNYGEGSALAVELSPPVKNLVNVFVCKFFALDIGLDKITGKLSQEKLAVVRKLFSKVNGFGRASTPSKFAGIIRATFTSELSLVQASKKAEEAKILVNTVTV